MKKLTLLSFGLWLMGQSLLAQGTVESYNRAFSLQDKFKDKVFYANVTPQWIGNSSRFWYVQNAPQGKTYILVDAQKKTRTDLFDHNKLAVELALATDNPVDAKKLPLQSLKVTEALDSLHFVYNSYNWTYAFKQNSLKKGDKVVAVKEEYWGKVDTEREG